MCMRSRSLHFLQKKKCEAVLPKFFPAFFKVLFTVSEYFSMERKATGIGAWCFFLVTLVDSSTGRDFSSKIRDESCFRVKSSSHVFPVVRDSVVGLLSLQLATFCEILTRTYRSMFLISFLSLLFNRNSTSSIFFRGSHGRLCTV